MRELQKLAEYVCTFHLENVQKEVLFAAKHCLLDTISVGLGGSQTPQLKQIQKQILEYEPSSSPQGISLWGSCEMPSLRTAVFLNSMACHVLELDDVHTGSKTHIGTVVIPAAWGMCEYLKKTGRDLIEAIICGYEVMSRIGMGFGVSSHRNKGWHVTGTAGTFGAAAACGKLLNFSPEQMMAAFGLAGAQSCSTWAFLSDGATNKILHPGRAAANGLDACILTLAGMKGSSHILDAEDGGLFPMMSDHYDFSLISKGLGSIYEILNVDKKPYPCCRSTHCAIDAAIYLKNLFSILPENIDHVQIKTYMVGVKQCGLSSGSIHPTISAEAKFSTPYVTACALLNGNVSLSDFYDSIIQQPQRQELLRKIHVYEDPKFTAQYPEHWGCEMQIHLKNGTVHQCQIRDASGSITAPLTLKQLLLKSGSCLPIFPEPWVSELQTTLLNIENEKLLTALSA